MVVLLTKQTQFLVLKLPEREILDDLDLYWKVILKWIGNKYSGVMWIMFFTFRIRCVMGFCEYDNETSSSVKGDEFLELLSGLASEEQFCYMALGNSVIRFFVCLS